MKQRKRNEAVIAYVRAATGQTVTVEDVRRVQMDGALESHPVEAAIARALKGHL